MTVRVGVNGFGRMGRAFLRIAEQEGSGVEVVAVNDLGAPDALVRLLRRDSVYGRYPRPVDLVDGAMLVGAHRVTMLHEREVKALPWSELGVDVVVEATGRFTARDEQRPT